MKLEMIFSMLLAVQPFSASDGLVITKDQVPITKINQMDFFYPYIDLPIIDSNKFQQFLEQLDAKLSKPPENAKLDKNGNIIPERAGVQINRDDFTGQIFSYFFNDSPSTIEIPMMTVHAKVDSELLSDIRTMRIGRYITSFNPGNKNRSTNIKLATEAINNTVVFPGETFSFNKVVGKRTEGKGYQRAKVIVRGEYSDDIGGGICQVSSTLFNAVDSAGLEIVQRFSHSRDVPYIPPGRDATVSWYGPDFEFRNTYNQPVLIQARTMGSLLIIKLYSSESINYVPKKIPQIF